MSPSHRLPLHGFTRSIDASGVVALAVSTLEAVSAACCRMDQMCMCCSKNTGMAPSRDRTLEVETH